MTAPTLNDLRKLRAEGMAASVPQSVFALLDLAIAQLEASAASTLVDGSDDDAATAKDFIVDAIRNEREKREEAQREVAALKECLMASEKNRLAAEHKRDEWKRGYDAMSADVAKIRTAFIGLTVPRPDLAAEVDELRAALKVEREACDEVRAKYANYLPSMDGWQNDWNKRHDARRAAEKVGEPKP